MPYGWKTHNSFVFCENREHHATEPEYYHSALFTDINNFIDDDEPQLTAYCISIGRLYEEDVREWLESHEDAELLPTIETARDEWKDKYTQTRISNALLSAANNNELKPFNTNSSYLH